MKKLIALTAMAGLLAAGCASQENRGGSYDDQTAPGYGNGTSNSEHEHQPGYRHQHRNEWQAEPE